MSDAHPGPEQEGRRGARRTAVAGRSWSLVLLVLVAGVIVISPLLQPGYFWGAHDARHDVYFIFQYDQSVQDGIWFPRWSPDFAFGYGYPFFIVYGPLATFLGELFHHFLGLGYEASVKAVLALTMLASGLAMYGFVGSWLGRRAAFVAAIAYMTVPYHLVDTYVRAAMAESVSLAFLPLALWGLRETIRRPRPAAILGAGAAYAAIMWTSPLVAIVFTPALLAYLGMLIFWQLRLGSQAGKGQHAEAAGTAAPPRSRTPLRLLLAPAAALALGLGLSAAFFVPALVEQRYINRTQWFGQYYDPTQHFVYFSQLFNPAWGFGISQPGPNDAALGSMSFQLGAGVTLLSLVALVLAGRFRPRLRHELGFWALWALVSILLTLNVSALAWRYLPIVPYAQFPWRYLMLAIIPLSILPATLVAAGEKLAARDAAQMLTSPAQTGAFAVGARDGGHPARWPALLLGALLLLSSYPYLRIEIREPTPEQGPVSYAALMRFQRTSDEMTGVTAWVDPELRPRWSDMAELWVQGGDVSTRVDYSRVPQDATLAVHSAEMGSAHEQVYYYAAGPGQRITFNRFWYPGWTAYLLDGKDGRPLRKLPVVREEGPLARVAVPVPVGEGYLLLRFEDTPLRAAAKWITLATLGGVVVWVVARALRQRRR